ncbi:hypothetical protein BKA62DRAFT_826634 [Auriculariales sp. MPI-PUGE-AT-0066]|nr:hypothetical protein BKA62DRAFT_826634 [Auriculariales sp. MPI-PUGE-AT-0066]
MRFILSSLTILSTVATAVVAGPLLDGQLGSLDSRVLRSLESLDSVDLESFDAADLTHDFDERAADDCAGVSLRARSGLNGADIGPKDCSRAMGPSGNGLGAFYAYNKAPEKIAASSDPKTAKVKAVKANGPQKETNIYGKKTCDHVLELNVLKTILNKGACDAADAMTEPATYTGKDPSGNAVSLQVTEGQKRILEIREIVMRPRNLVSLQGRIEELKTQTMQRFSGLGASAVGQKYPLDYLAMADYTLQKTVTWSLETASLLDAAISQHFPGAPTGVQNRWIVFLAFVRKQAQDRMKQIENEKRGAQCAAAPAAPGAPASGHTKRGGGTFSGAFNLETRALDKAIKARGLEDVVAKFERKSKTAAAAVGFTPRRTSSLERRAAGKTARRSGPKAAAGPSCPAKKQTPKKQVKKSAAKMKPTPAKKPRRPANRPAPRKPTGKKQVAKRPITRPRRTPGKQIPRKRTTPRRKPKRVPKPTRRPKGKARPRRRRK